MLNISSSQNPSAAPYIHLPGVSKELWYAVHVRYNLEFKTLHRLQAVGIEAFLPSYSSVRRWSDRTVTLDRPLFPGYLFVHMSWRDKLRVISQSGVLSVVGGPESNVDVTTIDQLRLAVSNSAVEAYDEPGIVPGDRVRVVSGPFIGMEGKLDRWQSKCRIIVTLQTLDRSFALHIDAADVCSA
jgi:transcription antitermination factor NusG